MTIKMPAKTNLAPRIVVSSFFIVGDNRNAQMLLEVVQFD